MDFHLDDDQKALSELAARILSEQTTPARLKAVETEAAAGGDGVDHKLWADMAAAGLVAAPLAEEHGGAGIGLIGAAAVLEEVGRHVAPVPYLETVVSALALERFGSASLREHLGELASGSLVISPALLEAQASPRRPSARALAAPGALTARRSVYRRALPPAGSSCRRRVPTDRRACSTSGRTLPVSSVSVRTRLPGGPRRSCASPRSRCQRAPSSAPRAPSKQSCSTGSSTG
jgi:hypothetical protein